MRLRFPIPVAVIASVVGLGAIAVAGAQESPQLQAAANPQVSYTVALNGANEVAPNVGDPDGTGTATVTVNGTTGQVCVNITTALVEPMTLMHIHTGAAGVNGPVFVDFAVPSGTSTAIAKCVTATPAQAAAIIADPTGHYLNAHSASFPNGAIRGQLALAGNTAGALHLLDEPLRAYDSRSGTDGKLVVGTARTVDLSSGINSLAASVAAVPPTARAAVVTITVTQTVGSGFVTAYSNALTVAPATSTINWTAANSDIGTTTTVAVDGSGKIALLAGLNGTHVIVDVIGYYL
jgi:CHRD domain